MEEVPRGGNLEYSKDVEVGDGLKVSVERPPRHPQNISSSEAIIQGNMFSGTELKFRHHT